MGTIKVVSKIVRIDSGKTGFFFLEESERPSSGRGITGGFNTQLFKERASSAAQIGGREVRNSCDSRL